MHRIAFIKLGITLVATEAWLSGCADDGGGSQASGGAGAGARAGGTNPSGGSGGEGASAGAGGATAGQAGSSGTGPGAGSGGTAGSTECTTAANLVQTSTESHDHLPLTTPITAAELNAGAPTEYALPLEQNHIHTLSFTEADFAKLRSGMILSKRSSSMMGHTHTYSIQCV